MCRGAEFLDDDKEVTCWEEIITKKRSQKEDKTEGKISQKSENLEFTEKEKIMN